MTGEAYLQSSLTGTERSEPFSGYVAQPRPDAESDRTPSQPYAYKLELHYVPLDMLRAAAQVLGRGA